MRTPLQRDFTMTKDQKIHQKATDLITILILQVKTTDFSKASIFNIKNLKNVFESIFF